MPFWKAQGAFAAGEFAPLNRIGDTVKGRIWNGRLGHAASWAIRRPIAPMSTAAGARSTGPRAYGGQGLPFSLATVVLEDLGDGQHGVHIVPDADRGRD